MYYVGFKGRSRDLVAIGVLAVWFPWLQQCIRVPSGNVW
jgi:hypothetical protein